MLGKIMLAHVVRLVTVFALPVAVLAYVADLRAGGAYALRDIDIQTVCVIEMLQPGRQSGVDCSAWSLLWVLNGAAWLALALTLVPILLFRLIAAACGARRSLNAAVFRRLVPVTIGVVALNVLVQGALLLLLLVFAYNIHAGRPPVAAIAAAGAGILGAMVTVVIACATIRTNPLVPARARPLGREQAPQLWALIDGAAEALGTRAPDAVIVGLNPMLWMVAGSVVMRGANLTGGVQGRVMHLPLPLMRVLTVDELGALIAHELAHFRRRDAAYTSHFAPVYAQFGDADAELDDQEITGHGNIVADALVFVARLPARALLAMLGSAFAANVRRIAIKRERQADRAAAKLVGARTLAAALLKVPLFAKIWSDTVDDQVARVRLGLPAADRLSQTFADLAALLITPEARSRLRFRALSARIRHPYDSHPTCSARVRAVGVGPSTLTVEMMAPPADGGAYAALLPATVASETEFVLTLAEYHALAEAERIPAVPTLGAGGKVDPLYEAVYSLLASLVSLGDAPARRFVAATAAGNAEMTDFDRMVFAEYCRGHRPRIGDREALAYITDNAGVEGIGVLGEIAKRAVADETQLDEASQLLIQRLSTPLGQRGTRKRFVA
ncbi:MAG: M48 family metallopeptidase [Pseudomonadota bacterium]